MAKGKSSWFQRLRRQCSHKRLLLVEAVLLLAAGEMWLEDYVMASSLHPAWQILFAMALVVGTFGLLLALAHSVVLGSLDKGHKAVQALPLPTPVLLVHGLALVGLFYLYAWQFERPVWPLA